MSLDELAQAIKHEARRLGFDGVGITSIACLDRDLDRLEFWNRLGFSARMRYMQEFPRRLAQLKASFSQAKSIIALAVNYYTPEPNGDCPQHSSCEVKGTVPYPIHGRIARYAWGKNYHKAIHKRLKQLEQCIHNLVPQAQVRRFVDTGPIPERAVAQAAGLGFIGKNTMLITRHAGSWVFLAELITDLELASDEPGTGTCGSCTLCLEACPTGALVEPYVLDARRCISYWTIEHRGPIPPEIAAQTGDWLFGCDICLEVCPHNRAKVRPTAWPEFYPDQGPGPSLPIEELMTLGDTLQHGNSSGKESVPSLSPEEAFRRRFQGTSLMRAKHTGLLRNAAMVLAHASKSGNVERGRPELKQKVTAILHALRG